MPLTEQQRSKLLARRIGNVYRSQKRRAKLSGIPLDYGAEKLRDVVRYALQVMVCCPFCGTRLTERNFSIDHEQPTSRGGAHAFANLHVTCRRCNEIKGPLSTAEFAQLLAVLLTWPAEARRNVLARLRAGARFCRR